METPATYDHHLPGIAPDQQQPDHAPATKSANRLTAAQTIKLGDWVRSNVDSAKNLSDAVCAGSASLVLGFSVTTANFSAIRTALEIEKTQPAKPLSIEERLEAAEKKIDELAADLDHLLNRYLHPVLVEARPIDTLIDPNAQEVLA
jgi:hypothetical protein